MSVLGAIRRWIGRDAELVDSCPHPESVTQARGGRLRTLLVTHVAALVLARVLCNADDFVNWDLTVFLNANVADSLWALLNRPEVHFRNPFYFPPMNVGGESVLSIMLFRAFGHVSLYWSNVAVLLVYDAAFLTLLGVLLRQVHRNVEAEVFAWLLFAMSPTLLTFLSTSAFNVQGYCLVLLGLLSCQYILEKRVVRGVLLLTLTFVMISQAYPLAFYLPYFAVAWAFWSVTRDWQSPAKSWRVRLALGVASLAAVAALALAVNHLSGGVYFTKIAPADPYAVGSSESAVTRLARSSSLFLRAAFAPAESFDGSKVGFGPYFLLAAVLLAAIASWVGARRRPAPPERWTLRRMLPGLFSLGLILLGYVPGFISVVPKNQRAFFGDLFLVIVAAAWLGRLWRRPSTPRTPLGLALALLLVASDVYYLSVSLSVDHGRNHWPRFDFDRSDGVARHDFIAAIEMMRRQVEQDHAGLVIYYPRGYAENTTDPAMFFARFLRHFGRYSHRSDLVFPCRWCAMHCSWCTAYGCPFPEVIEEKCGSECCYSDPLAEIAKRPELAGRRMVLWWNERNKVDGMDLAATLASFARDYDVAPVDIPDAATGWTAYSLSPHPERRRRWPMAREDEARRIVVIGCDDSGLVMVNGQLVGEVVAWKAPVTFALPVGTERTLVAVKVTNNGGPGGLIGTMIFDPGRESVSQPARWVCSAERRDGWYLPAFDEQAWTEPKVRARHGSLPWGFIDVLLAGADWVWTEDSTRPQTVYCRWWIAGSSSGP